MSSPLPVPRSTLRRELRERRRALSGCAQHKAAHALALRLRRLPPLCRARHVALYWPNDGEIDPRLLQRYKPRHQHLYLPVLQAFPAQTLCFVRWSGTTRLARNRFGIPEPRRGARRPARAMDVILLPLVGFDSRGNRLGMGGGFYDRTLAFTRRHAAKKPWLAGLAHACQQVPALDAAPWDVPLQLIATDTGCLHP
ncbi:MAG: 5-formyltetrahydrofolate cyclo-ligase [Gammaproteobacteria bacterium]